jgi:hypothetical protein
MIIKTDIFPAHVAVAPSGAFESVDDLKSSPPSEGSHYVGTTRVIIVDDLVVVAVDSPSGPNIVFREKIETYLKGAKSSEEHRIVTISGKMLAFKKDSNCGCGSRLRSWNPYNTVNSIKD